MKFAIIASLFVFGILMGTAQSVRADIVMINLNGATQEVDALRRLTEKFGERLFVLPETTGDGTYDNSDLAKDIHRLARMGVRPRALVASGHHFQDQYFYGTNGKFFLFEISTDLTEAGYSPDVQDFMNSVRSLYLWGCYTGTLANTDKLVASRLSPFKNANYIVGFLKKGPLGVTQTSGTMLEKALEKEAHLRHASELERPAILKNILGQSRYDLIVHQNDNYSNTTQSFNRPEYLKTCMTPEAVSRYAKNTTTLYSYYNAVTPIPEDTSGGPLRSVYEELQDHRYCLEKNNVCVATKRQTQYDYIPPETAIRLIFYKNVIKNFSKVYAERLKYLHEGVLIPYGFKKSEFLTRLDTLDRKELIAQLGALNEENHDLNFDSKNAEKAKRYYFVRSALEDIQKAAYASDQVIPASWKFEESKTWGRFKVLNKFQEGMNRAVEVAMCLVHGCDEDLATLIPDKSPRPAQPHCIPEP